MHVGCFEFKSDSKFEIDAREIDAIDARATHHTVTQIRRNFGSLEMSHLAETWWCGVKLFLRSFSGLIVDVKTDLGSFIMRCAQVARQDRRCPAGLVSEM